MDTDFVPFPTYAQNVTRFSALGRRLERRRELRSWRSLYPDLARVGLAGALQRQLDEIGSTVDVEQSELLSPMISWVSAETRERSVQVAIAAQERLFIVAAWSDGIDLNGNTVDLKQVALVFDCWLSPKQPSGEETVAQFEWLALSPFAVAYERGEAIEFRWKQFAETANGIERLKPLVTVDGEGRGGAAARGEDHRQPQHRAVRRAAADRRLRRPHRHA
jgi:hypothetical protein